MLRRHPWIFESAIAKGCGDGSDGGDSGETVRGDSHDGPFLGGAAFSPASGICAWAWRCGEVQHSDASFFIAACAHAVSARGQFGLNSYLP
ncbi:hypothetical protein KI609_03820 [Acidovorax radicis]|nr:hypothetical protein KI609_03820 [Acidovorax radicis]